MKSTEIWFSRTVKLIVYSDQKVKRILRVKMEVESGDSLFNPALGGRNS